MDEKFQDRIDDFLLNRMKEEEKEKFLQEVEQDEERQEQLAFTKHVKDSVCSREEKLRALEQFRQWYEEEREATAMRPTGTEGCAMSCEAAAPAQREVPVRPKRKTGLWILGIAAVLAIGFFAVSPMFRTSSSPDYERLPMEQMRGGDEVFGPVPVERQKEPPTLRRSKVFSPAPADSTDNDTIGLDKEKKGTTDE